MVLSEREVLTQVRRLSATRLRAWVASGWVQPGGGDGFTEVDVARLEFLCTLTDDLALDDEALPVVLSLVDQLHGVRHALRGLIEAVEQQPETVREEIARALRERDGG